MKLNLPLSSHKSAQDQIPNPIECRDIEENKVNLREDKAIKYYQQKYLFQLGLLNAENSSEMSNALSQLIDNDQSLAEEGRGSHVNLSNNLKQGIGSQLRQLGSFAGRNPPAFLKQKKKSDNAIMNYWMRRADSPLQKEILRQKFTVPKKSVQNM